MSQGSTTRSLCTLHLCPLLPLAAGQPEAESQCLLDRRAEIRQQGRLCRLHIYLPFLQILSQHKALFT